MRTVRVVGITAAVVMAFAYTAFADEAKQEAAPAGEKEITKPIQIAIAPPSLQLVREEQSVQGIRLDLIYGRNRNMTGVDIGLVHETSNDFKGVDFGIVSIVHGDGRGLQFNGIYTESTKHMSGLQVGMFNRSNSMSGIQIGLVNFADDMTGFQFGLWNEIKNKEKFPIIPFINAAF